MTDQEIAAFMEANPDFAILRNCPLIQHKASGAVHLIVGDTHLDGVFRHVAIPFPVAQIALDNLAQANPGSPANILATMPAEGHA